MTSVVNKASLRRNPKPIILAYDILPSVGDLQYFSFLAPIFATSITQRRSSPHLKSPSFVAPRQSSAPVALIRRSSFASAPHIVNVVLRCFMIIRCRSPVVLRRSFVKPSNNDVFSIYSQDFNSTARSRQQAFLFAHNNIPSAYTTSSHLNSHLNTPTVSVAPVDKNNFPWLKTLKTHPHYSLTIAVESIWK